MYIISSVFRKHLFSALVALSSDAWYKMIRVKVLNSTQMMSCSLKYHTHFLTLRLSAKMLFIDYTESLSYQRV